MCKSKEFISTKAKRHICEKENGIYVVTEVKGVSVRTFSVKSKGFIYEKQRAVYIYERKQFICAKVEGLSVR